MKNAILYNIITADVQTGTQSSTIKKKHRFRGAKNKKNKYEQNLLLILL